MKRLKLLKIKYITQNDSKIDNDLNNSNTIKKENNSLINTINYKILVNKIDIMMWVCYF